MLISWHIFNWDRSITNLCSGENALQKITKNFGSGLPYRSLNPQLHDNTHQAFRHCLMHGGIYVRVAVNLLSLAVAMCTKSVPQWNEFVFDLAIPNQSLLIKQVRCIYLAYNQTYHKNQKDSSIDSDIIYYVE